MGLSGVCCLCSRLAPRHCFSPLFSFFDATPFLFPFSFFDSRPLFLPSPFSSRSVDHSRPLFLLRVPFFFLFLWPMLSGRESLGRHCEPGLQSRPLKKFRPFEGRNRRGRSLLAGSRMDRPARPGFGTLGPGPAWGPSTLQSLVASFQKTESAHNQHRAPEAHRHSQ